MRQALRAAAASPVHYERRRPEETTLYRLVQEHLETFLAEVEAGGSASLPQFVKDEFDEFLECGILAHGFLRVRCTKCGHEKRVAFSCKRRGICPSCGARRMAETAAWLVDHVIPKVPVRQWVLSFPIPLRSLFAVHPELLAPVLQIIHRVIATHLIKQAGVKRSEAATGAVTLIQRFGSAANLCDNAHGFSLPAGVRCAAEQRSDLEHLCRYITRPAIANERLSVNHAGQVVLKLKTPYRDGTSHLVMSPLEFMQRLAALVPRPRLHLIRFHGVLAPHAKLRAAIVPIPTPTTTGHADCEPAHGASARMSWARLLKRVFDFDVERCGCGGKLKLIAAIEAPALIERILTHLGLSAQPPPRTPARRVDIFQAA